ncbi:MAG: hypothetical protein HPY50_02900 [Firmicutes bacterium]|nr:hypothetical protein [Bacillota bacterium]
MYLDAKPQEKKENGVAPPPPRQIYAVPLPKDINRCEGCPYPGVGFICWSGDGSCLRTEMDRVGRPGRRCD